MRPETTKFTVRPLNEDTWPAFAKLVEENGGIWGGCWCIAYHLDPTGPKGQMKPYRDTKHRLMQEGHAHAAMVFEGENALGWCQFGAPHELPNVRNRRNYEKDLDRLPDWRITCFFVGKAHRHRGIANAALAGALDLIAELGGGLVEAYPEDVEGRKTSSSFLHGGTLKMFRDLGFDPLRPIGKNQWVVRRTVKAQRADILQRRP